MKLAINNGPKLRTKFFPPQKNIGIQEETAIKRVLESGLLSGYRGSYQEAFFGGPECKAFEKEFAAYHNTRYAIACNSCTSALQIACLAIGLGPGDEVIVTGFSMSCSASAPLVANAVPVFADIERDYFCLDPLDVERKINEKTKAIIVVDLFGQPYNHCAINQIAIDHGLYIIEDAAQAIGSKLLIGKSAKYAGTFGDLGVFSFTQGKIIHSGEGGIIITNNFSLALRCQLIRNHAEAVLSSWIQVQKTYYRDNNIKTSNNMIGFNMRMTEIQAAILREQLKKLDEIVKTRQKNVAYMHGGLSEIPAITPAPVRQQYTHSYYVDAYYWDKEKADEIHRDIFIDAVCAELTPSEDRLDRGVPIGKGYIQPLYLNPLFQRKKLYGGANYPFNLATTDLEKNYSLGSCPVTEKLWKEELFISLYHGLDLDLCDHNDIAKAFGKVWDNRSELQGFKKGA